MFLLNAGRVQKPFYVELTNSRCGHWEVRWCDKVKNFFAEIESFSFFWIFLVYDATAKMPSGLLNGHVNQYGDFDLCLNALTLQEVDHVNFNSQYCLAGIQIIVDQQQKFLEYLRTLFLSFESYKSEFDDVSSLKYLLTLGTERKSSLKMFNGLSSPTTYYRKHHKSTGDSAFHHHVHIKILKKFWRKS